MIPDTELNDNFFDETSVYFIQEWGKIVFAHSMCVQTFGYVLKINSEDYWDYYHKRTRKKLPKNFYDYIAYLQIYRKMAANDDYTNETYRKSKEFNPQYWIDEYNAYLAYRTKHGKEPDYPFTIPKFFFDLYKNNIEIQNLKDYVK